MLTESSSAMKDLIERLDRFPSIVTERFRVANKGMPQELDDEQIINWAEVGLGIADQTVRSWEAASNFYVVSPVVLAFMPHSYFLKWMSCGVDRCEQSPTLASSYFEASPEAMSKLRSRHIESWAELGNRLYKGTWKSTTLSCTFFQHSPKLLDTLSFQELALFVAFLFCNSCPLS